MKKIAFWSIVIMFAMVGCNSQDAGMKTAKNGVKYKIIPGNGKDSLLRKGNVIAFSITQKMGDSVAFNSYEGGHQISQVDTVAMPLDFKFVFTKMRLGDSAFVKISADSMYSYEKNRAMQGNPNFNKEDFDKNVPAFFLKKGNYLSYGIKILDKFETDSTKPNFKTDTARYFVFAKAQQEKQTAYRTKMEDKMRKADSALSLTNKAAGVKFLTANKTKTGIATTASGLQYQILKAGTGAKPLITDKAKVHYFGTLLDGTEFDNSLKRGEPATFQLTNVVKGWTEVLQLMPAGSKYKVWLPSDIGYGDNWDQNHKIPPGSTLVFEIELLELNPKEEKPTVTPEQGQGQGQMDEATMKKIQEMQKNAKKQ